MRWKPSRIGRFLGALRQAWSPRLAVRVDEFDNEVFTDNNTFPVGITVTDERTKLLIIEQRPRWEFRYLRNLFQRDPNVSVNSVVGGVEPDREGFARGKGDGEFPESRESLLSRGWSVPGVLHWEPLRAE